MSVSYDTTMLRHRRAFNSGCLRTAEQRIDVLSQLERMMRENEKELCSVVYDDIRRSEPEAWMYEMSMVYNEIANAKSSLTRWMKPERKDQALLFVMDTPEVHKDPLGVVLIIGAWNYPVNLTLVPLIAALAAGNCAVATNTSACLARLVGKYISADVVSVVEGGVPETTELLKQRFDHIFYTGAPNVGKIVMTAAAKHLTPVTLELGGKCPAIVDGTGDLKLVAKRIAWGKFMSAGQTCLAPDYVMVVESCKADFIKYVTEAVESFYTADASQAKDYSRIISKRQFDRLQTLLNGAEKNIVYGGKTDESALYISPTIVDAKPSDQIMQDEIFGPILPIIGITNADDAIEKINGGEKPLAVYIFSTNKATINEFLQLTSSGGVTVNDCLLHMGCDSLPFGGVGMSGMGNYHGKYGFDTFSHHKAVLRRPQFGDSIFWIRYPPLTAQKFKIAKMLMKRRPFWNVALMRAIFTFIFGVGLGALVTYYLNATRQ